MVTIEEALAEATKNKRVCPLPKKWNEVYKLLPGKKQKGNGWEPPLPLILAAWAATSNLSKIARFREHLEWAAAHSALDLVYSYISNLSEQDWHHTED